MSSAIEPDPAAIEIVDIAHGLAHHCRFGGHTATFSSVGQHSCVVADAVAARGADRDAVLLRFEGLQ